MIKRIENGQNQDVSEKNRLSASKGIHHYFTGVCLILFVLYSLYAWQKIENVPIGAPCNPHKQISRTALQKAQSLLVNASRKTYSLNDLNDLPVWMSLWASWCTPCRTEAPLVRQYADKMGYRVQWINVDLPQQFTTPDHTETIRQNSIWALPTEGRGSFFGALTIESGGLPFHILVDKVDGQYHLCLSLIHI